MHKILVASLVWGVRIYGIIPTVSATQFFTPNGLGAILLPFIGSLVISKRGYKMLRIIITILLVGSIAVFQGCIPLMVAGAGYAIGQGRKGTAAQMDAKGKFLERYNEYKLGMEKINLEREKANLKPQPIDDFEVWLNQQPLTPEEQNLFRKYKAQTPNEYKVKDLKKEEDAKPTAQPVTQPTTQPSSNFKG